MNGQWTYFVMGADGQPLGEIAPTGNPSSPWRGIRDYVWLDGRLLAQVEYDGTGAQHTYYVHSDHLGTPRMMTSATGAIVWSTFQRPYGEVGEKTVADPSTGSTVVTNLRLPGQYDERLLGPLGLQGPYYNWNRWYLPGLGRYLEADPIALDGEFNTAYGVDWYGYASQNPTRWTDRYGLRIYTNYFEAPDQFGPPPNGKRGWAYLYLLPGAPPSKCEPSKCGDKTWGFDVNVSVLAVREFLNEQVMNERENPHDIWTVAQHEDFHMNDYREAFGHGLDDKFQTEGFSSPGACDAARRRFNTWLNSYYDSVLKWSKRWDRH